MVGAGFAVEFAFDAVLVAEWLAFEAEFEVVEFDIVVLPVEVVTNCSPSWTWIT